MKVFLWFLVCSWTSDLVFPREGENDGSSPLPTAEKILPQPRFGSKKWNQKKNYLKYSPTLGDDEPREQFEVHKYPFLHVHDEQVEVLNLVTQKPRNEITDIQEEMSQHFMAEIQEEMSERLLDWKHWLEQGHGRKTKSWGSTENEPLAALKSEFPSLTLVEEVKIPSAKPNPPPLRARVPNKSASVHLDLSSGVQDSNVSKAKRKGNSKVGISRSSDNNLLSRRAMSNKKEMLSGVSLLFPGLSGNLFYLKERRRRVPVRHRKVFDADVDDVHPRLKFRHMDVRGNSSRIGRMLSDVSAQIQSNSMKNPTDRFYRQLSPVLGGDFYPKDIVNRRQESHSDRRQGSHSDRRQGSHSDRRQESNSDRRQGSHSDRRQESHPEPMISIATPLRKIPLEELNIRRQLAKKNRECVLKLNAVLETISLLPNHILIPEACSPVMSNRRADVTFDIEVHIEKGSEIRPSSAKKDQTLNEISDQTNRKIRENSEHLSKISGVEQERNISDGFSEFLSMMQSLSASKVESVHRSTVTEHIPDVVGSENGFNQFVRAIMGTEHVAVRGADIAADRISARQRNVILNPSSTKNKSEEILSEQVDVDSLAENQCKELDERKTTEIDSESTTTKIKSEDLVATISTSPNTESGPRVWPQDLSKGSGMLKSHKYQMSVLMEHLQKVSSGHFREKRGMLAGNTSSEIEENMVKQNSRSNGQTVTCAGSLFLVVLCTLSTSNIWGTII